MPRAGKGKAAGAVNALARVLDDPSAQSAREALEAIQTVDGVSVFRREAWYEAIRSLELWQRSARILCSDTSCYCRNGLLTSGLLHKPPSIAVSRAGP